MTCNSAKLISLLQIAALHIETSTSLNKTIEDVEENKNQPLKN